MSLRKICFTALEKSTPEKPYALLKRLLETGQSLADCDLVQKALYHT